MCVLDFQPCCNLPYLFKVKHILEKTLVCFTSDLRPSTFTVDEKINVCRSQSLLTSVITAFFTLFISNGDEIKYTEHSLGLVTPS